ncbi:DNA/RNA non-specific endonuclease (plasmid) [Methylomarinum sp. Ch1-1]|uniref:DNA/RNA non-specific endonuclease n=1 Tax=Methylomarinum roseum TaxID=3067653 RepID=A0AAU7P0A4_9GAMM|nr:DNA/RNA non-specific endonuclease [Methylomarinum sp. Ch1-1]MDP4523290.1 DNA/RNA non-specific endonuclease [Methylomarinum sp. Ch1-1]
MKFRISLFASLYFTTCLSISHAFDIQKEASGLLRLNYEGFTVWVDCKERAAVKYRFNVQHDNGNIPRSKKFSSDPNVSKLCQQKSTGTYKKKGERWDRGHMVNANSQDNNRVSIMQTNYMTNILPQTAELNRGAFYQTELIAECYRDIDELLVLGGVIWGDDKSNDYFVQSHGVRTPDYFWKVIVRQDRVIAWVLPNNHQAKKSRLDKYLVSVADIEKITGEVMPVADYLKHDKLKTSWPVPRNCNKS